LWVESTESSDDIIDNSKLPQGGVTRPGTPDKVDIAMPSPKVASASLKQSPHSSLASLSTERKLASQSETGVAGHDLNLNHISSLKRKASLSLNVENCSAKYLSSDGPSVSRSLRSHKRLKADKASMNESPGLGVWNLPIQSINTRQMYVEALDEIRSLHLSYEATEEKFIVTKYGGPHIDTQTICNVTRGPLKSAPYFVRIETKVGDGEKRIFDIKIAKKDHCRQLLAT